MKHTYKLALITGATSGIGEEFARQLPAGTNLILTGRNNEKLRELQTELASQTREVEVIEADLATPEGIAGLIDAVKSKPVDLFINNAGLGFYGPMESHTASQEQAMVHVNVVAVAALAQALCPNMAARAAPSAMIVVSSVAGFMALPGFATYAASKMFDLSLAEGLAEEYKQTPLKIQALCPGPTRTAFGLRAGIPADGGPDKTAMSAREVVTLSLKKLGKKRIVVPGLLNKISVMPAKFLPRSLLARITGAVIKRTKQM